MADLALECGYANSVGDLMHQAGNLRQHKFFNALLTALQRPHADYLLPAHEWEERWRRTILPNEHPIRRCCRNELGAFQGEGARLPEDHEDNVALQKVRQNKQLTDTDLSALEEMLVASGAGGRDDIARAVEESQGLGIFIRSLVGLDREAATEAFSEFLTDSRFSAADIRFIQLIVERLTANGVMEPRRLYEAPFTDHAPTGPDLLFNDTDVDRIIDLLDSVKARALASAAVA